MGCQCDRNWPGTHHAALPPTGAKIDRSTTGAGGLSESASSALRSVMASRTIPCLGYWRIQPPRAARCRGCDECRPAGRPVRDPHHGPSCRSLPPVAQGRWMSRSMHPRSPRPHALCAIERAAKPPSNLSCEHDEPRMQDIAGGTLDNRGGQLTASMHTQHTRNAGRFLRAPRWIRCLYHSRLMRMVAARAAAPISSRCGGASGRETQIEFSQARPASIGTSSF